MKQMEVQKIPYGETFWAFRDTFVALDRVEGGVLAIRRDIWKKAPFDKDGRKDFRNTSIRKDLSDYLIDLWKNGVEYEDSGKESDGTEEEALYEKYIDYISDWVNNRTEFRNAAGESPMNYETWKAWDEGDDIQERRQCVRCPWELPFLR